MIFLQSSKHILQNMIIRAGNIADAASMADIFNYYIANSTAIFSNRIRTADDMEALIGPVTGRFPFYVAVNDEGRVDGYCFAHLFMPDPVYSLTLEVTIYLRHGVTGQGIGRRLLGQVIDDCRTQGVHILVSFITDGNEACERLHTSLGFSKVGVIREAGYKFGEFLGDAIYQLML